jgi:CspA family cold shock protein
MTSCSQQKTLKFYVNRIKKNVFEIMSSLIAFSRPTKIRYFQDQSAQFRARFQRRCVITNKEATMATGTVKWFNPQKGFGFIQPEGGGNDVFVHISAVSAAGLQTLNDGQKISYEISMERGKESATNLKAA